MADWEIREPREGRIVLWRDKVRVDEFTSVSLAQQAAGRQMSRDDSLTHVEPDGYRYRIKGPRRRHWRAAPA